MSKAVKRQYHSPRRVAQARSTREAIRRAARDLFLAEGYAATTINAIAEEADVAPQTIYSQFGTKATIAKELLDVSIVGDEEPVPVARRPWFTRVFDDGITGHERLRRYASAVRRIYEGAGSAFEIVRRGADGDPELAELWATNQAARRTVVAQILDAALVDTPLRPGLTRDEAVDLFWVLHGPELFHLLTVDSGWTADRYETWVADAFCEQLLAPPRRNAPKAPVAVGRDSPTTAAALGLPQWRKPTLLSGASCLATRRWPASSRNCPRLLLGHGVHGRRHGEHSLLQRRRPKRHVRSIPNICS